MRTRHMPLSWPSVLRENHVFSPHGMDEEGAEELQRERKEAAKKAAS